MQVTTDKTNISSFQQREREREREQFVTTAVNHMTFQNRIFFGQQPTLARKPSTR